MKPILKYFPALLLLFAQLPAYSQSREEFNGPFAGWADVKKQFGAKGNGKDDDTRALQQAINNLHNSVTGFNKGNGAYMVLYLPAGTYCISSTLVLRGQIGVSIIGENPANTIIKWIGRDKDTMFWANGSAYFKIARLTWNANNKKEIGAIGIHWKDRWDDGKTKSFASLNIEVSDCYFRGNCHYGIVSGTYTGSDGTGANDSEITIKRCVFDCCAEAGIFIHGFNALDYWIWDCQFLNGKIGIKCMHGNYHVYRSYFNGSTFCDLRNDNGYYTSMRGCYSENASGFSLDDGASCNPFKRIFQNNTVVNIKKNPIEFYHIGKITLWHNNLGKVQDKKIDYWVHTGSWCPAIYEVMSIRNKYETKKPLWNAVGDYTKFEFGDSYVEKITSNAAAFIKEMDPVPVKKVRRVFEVPKGAGSREIQEIINKAAALKGQRPVIHFGVGAWHIDKTLVIPEGSDMQLIGDGLLYASLLARQGGINFRGASLILVKGPSYVTIKDLQIGHESDQQLSAGIIFENTDQPASRAILDQIYSGADTSLVVDQLNYLYVEKNNSFFSAGNYLNGGELVKQGKGTARVCCFGGQFAKLSVNNGARFMAKDCWWEGNVRVPLDIRGSGEISLDGAMIAPVSVDSTPTIKVTGFNGKINLMNMYVQGSVSVDPGNSALNMLLWNIHFYHKLSPYQYIRSGSNAKLALLGANSQCFDNREICKNIISIPDKVYRVNDIPGFIDNMTSFDRSQKPALYRDLPNGVSNIYVSRVTIGAGKKGLVFIKQ